MGQEEISQILRSKYPAWVSVPELIEITKAGKNSVAGCLRRMRKRPEIEYRIKWGDKLTSHWRYLYRCRD